MMLLGNYDAYKDTLVSHYECDDWKCSPNPSDQALSGLSLSWSGY